MEKVEAKTNIVLIGMPSAGKTTIGKQVSNVLGYAFYDVDEAIVEKAGMRIPDIFSKYGEETFRKIESDCVKELVKKEKAVVSTGGGVIKKAENMEVLKESGTIFFIDRDLKKLQGYDPNRPLSSSKEAVAKLYEERYSFYQYYADVVVKNNDEIEDCVKIIIEKHKGIRK